MEERSKDYSKFRMGIVAAIATIVGTLFSGPLAYLAVSSIQPQPAWAGPQVYVDNYHPIQSVTFYFGFLLICGSLLMIAYVHAVSRDVTSLLALVFTSIACGLISFNYFTEATFIPALVRNYTPALDPVVSTFAVTNPSSLFWSIEMWGYGFLGLGTLFASGFFCPGGVEGVTRVLFIVNGVISLAGALYTSLHLEWVLSTAGLVSYGVWNVLYLVIGAMFLAVMLQRRSSTRSP
ncbi:MAG: hypothetical protein R6X31_06640 [Anaerolineae bacterium]